MKKNNERWEAGWTILWRASHAKLSTWTIRHVTFSIINPSPSLLPHNFLHPANSHLAAPPPSVKLRQKHSVMTLPVPKNECHSNLLPQIGNTSHRRASFEKANVSLKKYWKYKPIVSNKILVELPLSKNQSLNPK